MTDRHNAAYKQTTIKNLAIVKCGQCCEDIGAIWLTR